MVEAAKAELARLSREMKGGEQQMFPSTSPGDRGAVSPLGGVAKAEQPKATPKAKSTKKFVW
jgi:hypothetical protein